jgi:hypothetical protein
VVDERVRDALARLRIPDDQDRVSPTGFRLPAADRQSPLAHRRRYASNLRSVQRRLRTRNAWLRHHARYLERRWGASANPAVAAVQRGLASVVLSASSPARRQAALRPQDPVETRRENEALERRHRDLKQVVAAQGRSGHG